MSKWVFVMIGVVLGACTIVAIDGVTADDGTYARGDLDCNGSLNAKDTLVILAHLTDLTIDDVPAACPALGYCIDAPVGRVQAAISDLAARLDCNEEITLVDEYESSWSNSGCRAAATGQNCTGEFDPVGGHVIVLRARDVDYVYHADCAGSVFHIGTLDATGVEDEHPGSCDELGG